MSERTPERSSKTAQALDLLLDALLERQAARQSAAPPPVERPAQAPRMAAAPEQAAGGPARQPPRREPLPGEEGWEPPPQVPTMNLNRALGRFLAAVAILVIVVNLPINRYGTSLARLLPDSASLIIRDGLLLKGSGTQIFVVRDEKLRWISSLDAFDHLGFQWRDVNVVEDSFLARFEQGPPIHVLLKCDSSPHIYRLENNQKRWIRDIDTFLAEGHVWDDVRMVSCDYLRAIADGPPIPEDAGPPPQP